MSATGNSGVDSLVRRVDDDWYARKFTKEKRLREALGLLAAGKKLGLK